MKTVRIECDYKVLRTAVIDVDDKYMKLINNDNSDLEKALLNEVRPLIVQAESSCPESVSICGIFEADTDNCLVEF